MTTQYDRTWLLGSILTEMIWSMDLLEIDQHNQIYTTGLEFPRMTQGSVIATFNFKILLATDLQMSLLKFFNALALTVFNEH